MPKITMHFVVPAKRAPAPHMVSGQVAGIKSLEEILKQAIGHQGMNVCLACDPTKVTSEFHAGSGEPWALLAVVPDGDVTHVAIAPMACPKCLASPAWIEANKKFMEENDGKNHPRQVLPKVAPESAGCC